MTTGMNEGISKRIKKRSTKSADFTFERLLTSSLASQEPRKHSDFKSERCFGAMGDWRTI